MKPSVVHILLPFALAASVVHAAPRNAGQAAQELAKRIQNAQKNQERENKRNESEQKNWEKQVLSDLNGRMGLTPAQKTAAEKIVADGAQQVRRLDESPNLGGDERAERLNGIYAVIWERTLALLTDDQRAAARRRDQADDLVKTLNLSDTQANQLDASLVQLNKDVTKTRADKTLSQDAGNAKIAALESAMWAKFDGSLTIWQLNQVDSQRADDMVDAYAEKLKLTDEQRKQISPLALTAVKTMREIRSKTGVSDTDKETQVAAAKADFRAKIRPYLTTAQQRQLDALVAKPAQPTQTAQTLPAFGAANSK